MRKTHLPKAASVLKLAPWMVLVLLLEMCMFSNRSIAQPEEFKLTNQALDRARHMSVVWAPIEAGAPMIFYGPTPKSFDDLENAPQKMSDEEKETRIAAQILIDCGNLKPGTYPIKNFWRNIYPDARCPVGADTMAMIEIGNADVIDFKLTPEHLKLLKHSNRNLYGFDMKRPYGDMTYYYLDIADALGINVSRDKAGQPEFSEEQFNRFDKLHGEMLFTLQAYLQKATIELGTFKKEGYADWVRR